MPLQLRYTIINKNLILISFQKEFNNFLQGPYLNTTDWYNKEPWI